LDDLKLAVLNFLIGNKFTFESDIMSDWIYWCI